MTFVTKSSQDSPLLGRLSEHRVEVELELHSCASSHQVIFPLNLISALMCLQVDQVGEETKENKKDREDLGEDETKV